MTLEELKEGLKNGLWYANPKWRQTQNAQKWIVGDFIYYDKNTGTIHLHQELDINWGIKLDEIEEENGTTGFKNFEVFRPVLDNPIIDSLSPEQQGNDK